MKKILFFIIGVLVFPEGNAQNHLITFAGTGESTSVSSVEVENLTSGTSLTVDGTDVLRLTSTVGIYDVSHEKSTRIKIYPNPMAEKSTLLIYPPEKGNAQISVSDITGKRVTQTDIYLENYEQEFVISGLKSGLYLINVKGNTYNLSEKLISNDRSDGIASIRKISSNVAIGKKPSDTYAKGAQATVDMEYTSGDRLKFKGISGIYSTVLTDIPDADKTITFNFIDCTDGDQNHYPILEIGTQVWMGENLKTTSFKDGITAISLMQWNTNPGYLWYDNNASYKDTYGALYNWHAVITGNLCPTGWHVPSLTEYSVLKNYLGQFTSASKLRETGTAHWLTTAEWVTNETGFTALPGGWVVNANYFGSIGTDGNWWLSTEINSTYAYMIYISQYSSELSIYDYDKRDGFSVRCLKD